MLTLTNPRVKSIVRYITFGPWHVWNVQYDDGSTARIEMLCPCDGKDTIIVGEYKSNHSYAIIES